MRPTGFYRKTISMNSFGRFGGRAIAAVLATAGLAACVGPAPAPQRVDEARPSVTYNYRSDQELIEASNRAETYCRNYATLPRTANITNNPDGSNTIVFFCDRPMSTASMPMQATPALSYTYRTDQELVEITRMAENHCRPQNARPRAAGITANANGTKTIMLNCDATLRP